jgi:hypothetical protein
LLEYFDDRLKGHERYKKRIFEENSMLTKILGSRKSSLYVGG